MQKLKLLQETLRLADGGRVVCTAQAPDGSLVSGVIEQSFFEDFMGVPKPVLTPQRQARIVMDNVDYIEQEAGRLWQAGNRGEVVIR